MSRAGSTGLMPEDMLVGSGNQQPADVYRSEQDELFVVFSANKLAATGSRRMTGWSMRCVRNGRIGIAGASDPVEPRELAARAAELALWGEPTDMKLATPIVPEREVGDPGLAGVTADGLTRLGREVLEAVHSAHPHAACDLRLVRRLDRVATASSAGGRAGYLRRMLSSSLSVQLPTPDGLIRTGRFGVFGCQPTPEDVVRSLLEKLAGPTSLAPRPQGPVRVVLSPHAVYGVLCPVERMLNAKSVARGASAMAGRLGQQPFDTGFTLLDDPEDPGGCYAAPCDDEGVPARRRPLIDSGRVVSFYSNLALAQVIGGQGGNGLRIDRPGRASYENTPLPHPFSLSVVPGRQSPGELLADAGDTLLIFDILGTGHANNMSGDFALSVSLGYLVRGGEMVGRLTGVMLSGNVFDCLRELGGIGREATWVGGYVSTPALALPRIHVDTTRC